MQKRIATLLFAFTTASAFAQLEVSNAPVAYMIQNVLGGSNVQVSNITYNGGSAVVSPAALGIFTATNSNVPLASGIVLTNGEASGILGPNNATGSTTEGNDLLNGTDPDLLTLVQFNNGSSLHDWSIIEFDFVAIGDAIALDYVWGSEEYDTYIGSGFNDVFGIFISGPGISGPFSGNAKNIALVPGTSDYVAINTINNGQGNEGPCTNCQYYHQIGADSDMWTNPNDDIYTNPYYMQYDGYTDVLTAFSAVQCGETYHIKLAICDANDSGLDSGVFLKAGGLSANDVAPANLVNEVGGPEGNTVFEDCGSAELIIHRPLAISPQDAFTMYLSYAGTAANGIDYTTLPDSVVFMSGVDSVSISIDAITDGLAEGEETVQVSFTYPSSCGLEPITTEFSFFINDQPEALVVEDDEITICLGSSVVLTPIVSGGYANYIYDWSTGETTSGINVSPPDTTEYTVIVSDTCGLASASGVITVNILVTEPLLINYLSPSPWQLNCGAYEEAEAEVSGGMPPYDVTVTDDNGNQFAVYNSGDTYGFGFSSAAQGWVYATVADGCGNAHTDSIQITVNAPALTLTAPDTVWADCDGDFTINTVAGGGLTSWGYFYEWYWNGVQDFNAYTANYNSSSATSGIATITVMDDCGQQTSVDIVVVVSDPSFELSLIDELISDCTDTLSIAPEVTGATGSISYQWIANGATIASIPTLAYLATETVMLHLIVSSGCAMFTDSVLVTFIPNPIEIAADIVLTSEEGACDGSIALTLTNAIEPYTIVWNDAATTTGPVLADACEGDYYATITYGAGCTLNTDTYTIGLFILGDINTDGMIGIEDIMSMFDYYGCVGDCDNADLNFDGMVGFEDVQVLVGLME